MNKILRRWLVKSENSLIQPNIVPADFNWDKNERELSAKSPVELFIIYVYKKFLIIIILCVY